MWYSCIFWMTLCCLKQAGKLIQIQQQEVVVVVSLLIKQDFQLKQEKSEKHSLDGRRGEGLLLNSKLFKVSGGDNEVKKGKN